MARKDRAPNPPKKPQAPQRRSTPSGPRDAQRRRLLYILAATGLVGLAIVLGVVFLTGGGDKDLAATMESAGCQLKTVQAQVGNHSAAENATSNPKWNTDPPTSGPHFPVPAVYGEYDSPLKPAQFVHNLEHGYTVVWYRSSAPRDQIDALEQITAIEGGCGFEARRRLNRLEFEQRRKVGVTSTVYGDRGARNVEQRPVKLRFEMAGTCDQLPHVVERLGVAGILPQARGQYTAGCGAGRT